MEAGAAPDALLAYETTCAAMDEELLRVGSAMAQAVRQWSVVNEPCGAVVVPEVEGFARNGLAHDHRVGRVARRFCDADATFGFDSWTAGEVRAEAEQLVAQARSVGLDGGPWLGGFIDRLRVEGLDGLAEELESAPAPKRGFLGGLWEGLAEGSFDTQAYADGWGQFGKAAGQLVSGFAVYGDVRDAIAEYSRGNWLGGTFDAVGAIPGLGDAMKIVGFGASAASIVRRVDDAAAGVASARDVARAGDDVVEAASISRRELDDAIARAERGEWNVPGGLAAHEGVDRGHVVATHVISDEQLHERLATTKLKVVSTFNSEAEADAAIGLILRRSDDEVVQWLRGNADHLRLQSSVDSVGRVLRRGEPVREGRLVEVVLYRDLLRPSAFFVMTVKIYE